MSTPLAGFLSVSSATSWEKRLDSVCRIFRFDSKTGKGIEGCGTGFLIGENLLMTCGHVLPTPEACKSARAQFFYDDLDRSRRFEAEFNPGNQGFFYKDKVEESSKRVVDLQYDLPFDFSIVALKSNHRLNEVTRKVFRILDQETSPQPGTTVYTLQHPLISSNGSGEQYSEKKVSKGRILDHNKKGSFEHIDDGYNFHYSNKTAGGSSGGAVVTKEGKLVALHSYWCNQENSCNAGLDMSKLAAFIRSDYADKKIWKAITDFSHRLDCYFNGDITLRFNANLKSAYFENCGYHRLRSDSSRANQLSLSILGHGKRGRQYQSDHQPKSKKTNARFTPFEIYTGLVEVKQAKTCFTTVAACLCENMDESKATKQILLKDLFTKGNRVQIITHLLGASISQKSNKLAYEWALGNIWKDHLLFLIKLVSLGNAKNNKTSSPLTNTNNNSEIEWLLGALQNQMNAGIDELKLIREKLKLEQRIILLLDGYFEAPPEVQEKVDLLVKGGKKFKIIVMSRSDIPRLKFNRILRSSTLNLESAEMLTKWIFENNDKLDGLRSKVPSLLRTLASERSVLWQDPILLQMISELLTIKPQILEESNNLTHILSEIVDSLFLSKIKQEDRATLNEIAFLGIAEGSRIISMDKINTKINQYSKSIFGKNPINKINNCLDTLIATGVISKIGSPSSQKLIFLHPVLQEYLAARFLQIDNKNEILEKSLKDDNFRSTISFLAGLYAKGKSEDKLRDLLNNKISYKKGKSFLQMTRLVYALSQSSPTIENTKWEESDLKETFYKLISKDVCPPYLRDMLLYSSKAAEVAIKKLVGDPKKIGKRPLILLMKLIPRHFMSRDINQNLEDFGRLLHMNPEIQDLTKSAIKEYLELLERCGKLQVFFQVMGDLLNNFEKELNSLINNCQNQETLHLSGSNYIRIIRTIRAIINSLTPRNNLFFLISATNKKIRKTIVFKYLNSESEFDFSHFGGTSNLKIVDEGGNSHPIETEKNLKNLEKEVEKYREKWLNY